MAGLLFPLLRDRFLLGRPSTTCKGPVSLLLLRPLQWLEDGSSLLRAWAPGAGVAHPAFCGLGGKSLLGLERTCCSLDLLGDAPGFASLSEVSAGHVALPHFLLACPSPEGSPLVLFLSGRRRKWVSALLTWCCGGTCTATRCSVSPVTRSMALLCVYSTEAWPVCTIGKVKF